jgi:hypothetical protein
MALTISEEVIACPHTLSLLLSLSYSLSPTLSLLLSLSCSLSPALSLLLSLSCSLSPALSYSLLLLMPLALYSPRPPLKVSDFTQSLPLLPVALPSISTAVEMPMSHFNATISIDRSGLLGDALMTGDADMLGDAVGGTGEDAAVGGGDSDGIASSLEHAMEAEAAGAAGAADGVLAVAEGGVPRLPLEGS